MKTNATRETIAAPNSSSSSSTKQQQQTAAAAAAARGYIDIHIIYFQCTYLHEHYRFFSGLFFLNVFVI